MDSHGHQCPEETKQREEVVSISSTKYRYSNLSKEFSLFSRRYQYETIERISAAHFLKREFLMNKLSKKKKKTSVHIDLINGKQKQNGFPRQYENAFRIFLIIVQSMI